MLTTFRYSTVPLTSCPAGYTGPCPAPKSSCKATAGADQPSINQQPLHWFGGNRSLICGVSPPHDEPLTKKQLLCRARERSQVGIPAGGDLLSSLLDSKYNRLPLDVVTRATLLRRRQRKHFASRGPRRRELGCRGLVPCWVKGNALMGEAKRGQSPTSEWETVPKNPRRAQ